MKLKLIKDGEVVLSRQEYELYKQVYYRYSDIIDSVRNQTVAFQTFNYEDCVDVMLNYGRGFMPIKQFASDDPDYNRVCAEELVELLNQKQ